MVGYAEVPQQYITPKIQRRQASATLSRPPQDDLLSSHELSVLTDINEIINAQTTTIVQQPAEVDEQMTPSDNASSQPNVQLLQPEKKQRKINDRSTTSPLPEQEREKNKYYCDTCWRCYTRCYDLEDHKKKRCGKTEEKGEHKCEQCEEYFVKHNSLCEHVARVHDRKHPYECTRCGDKF